MMKKRCLALFSLVILCAACRAEPEKSSIGIGKPWLNAPAEALEAWRALKFGLFIHWGPVSLKGTEIGWSRGGQRLGTGGTGEIPVEVYDNLYKQFNPVQFDPCEWVKLAQDAGMKYLVFTSKHHDGFVNFDSACADYKITSPESPYRRDIVRQLADACREKGMKFGIYYSQPDWHHPDYRTERHSAYIQYFHSQVVELCSNYGKVDMIFFDGLGGKAEDWDAENLFKKIRALQPDVIINDRCGLPAEYDTPEQRIGSFQTDRAWETCMTLGDQWAWKPNDNIKSFEQCLRTLLATVGGDGNLLFNVGPMPDGRIEPRQADRLREIGAWLQTHSESIYGTRGGPLAPADWGVSTHKGDKVYLHIFHSGSDSLSLPPIQGRILSARTLSHAPVEFAQTPESLTLNLGGIQPDSIATLVELTLASGN